MRAIPQTACSENDSVDNIKGIVTYNNHPGTPQTSAYTFTDGCVDEDMGNLVPIVSKSVSPPSFEVVEDASVSFNSDNLFRWYLNSTTLQLDWENPTLQQIYNGVTTFAESDAVITVPNAGEWVYLMINTSIPVAHPIHLHGHDFFVMAQGINPWDGTTNSLVNPPRRDTAMLEGGGYLLIAFEADNPGAWLMHCHIGWHTNEGFALQFVEQEKEARKLIDSQALESNCANWKNYDASSDVVQDDSGI
jgi:FtsP/CotA-like multicopper oxidase with cupredoxin domain